jgi:membrane-bound serine protease (ClpP class)
MRNRSITIGLFITVLFLLSFRLADAGSASVYLVRITGAISPGNADFLDSAIRQANAVGAGCLIVMLDTPGGLAESMRKMVMAIYASVFPWWSMWRRRAPGRHPPA